MTNEVSMGLYAVSPTKLVISKPVSTVLVPAISPHDNTEYSNDM